MPQYHNFDITTLQLRGTCTLRPRFFCTVPVNLVTTQESDGEGEVAVLNANGGSNSYRRLGTYAAAQTQEPGGTGGTCPKILQ